MPDESTPPANLPVAALALVGALPAQLSGEGVLTLWYDSINSAGNVAYSAKVDQHNLDFLNASQGLFIDVRRRAAVSRRHLDAGDLHLGLRHELGRDGPKPT